MEHPDAVDDFSDISWDDDLPEPEHGLHIDVLHPDWEEDGRTALADLKVGQTLEGVITVQHLYHGAVVDVNGECDGCADGRNLFYQRR